MKRILASVVLIGGLGPACESSETPAPVAQPAGGNTAEVREDIYLRFTIDGDGFSSRRFDPSFGTDVRARNVNYWMAYQDREQTTFHMETEWPDGQVEIDFKIDAKTLGSYNFEPDDLGMNMNFELTFRDADGSNRRQYYAEQATVGLIEHDGEYISGTFSGRLFRGSMTNREEREFVTVSDGVFRVNWAEGQSNTNKARWPQ